MATKTKILGFNPKKMYDNMLAIAVEEQNKRLVEYAQQRIMLLGETISMYHSRNNMDDTGNLLDSLCWGVLYNGKYVANGFYRQQKASISSGLHRWWKGGKTRNWKVEDHTKLGAWESFYTDDLPEVWGHEMAQNFIDRQEKEGQSGWKVFFAILAPYWGYWEKGFNLRHFNGSSSFIQFAVMTQFRDHVREDLKPARVSFRVTSAINYSQMGILKTAKRNSRRKDRESAARANAANRRRKTR